MTSIKIFNFQLHEQFVDFRLNIEHEMIVFYNSNIEIHEVFKNQLNFQTLYIKFRTLKQENEILKQKNARLRVRRNEYRQKFHQLKKMIDNLRLQFNKRENVYDSNAKHAKQIRKSNILRFDFHSFNRSNNSFFFVIFTFFAFERFLLFYVFASHFVNIKYFDIDDFYDDKEKWKQWKENLLTKIWICFLQFSIEQHKINYARRYTKETAYDIIKTRTNIDNENFYSTIDELLKNLNVNFDQNKNIKQRKVYVKIFDDNFRMIEIEQFEIFITRYIVVVADFQIIDEILIYQLKLKLSFVLRNFIDHLTETHKYHEFVNDFRYIAQHVEELKIERNENKNKSYSNLYSLTKKEKKTFRCKESLL